MSITPMSLYVYLICAGGHAKQVIDIFLDNKIEIKGIFDDNKTGQFYRGTQIIGTISDIAKYQSEPFFCTVGDNQIREKISQTVGNVEWINCISKLAYISPSVVIGKGNYVGTHSKILADSRLGDFNIVNEGATLTHDNIIGDFNHIAPNVSVGGRVKIGNFNLIGTNSTVNPDVLIANNITIGSGATVIKSLVDPGIYIGTPCKKINKNISDKYTCFPDNKPLYNEYTEDKSMENTENNKQKIPCFVLIYDQVDIIKKCLSFFTKYNSRLDIIVIENFSQNTNETIKPYVMNLLNKKKIWKYYLFENNIMNNAYHMALQHAIKTYLDPKKYPYTLITDGDLTIDNEDWIEEQINIMESNKNIYVSSCSLDTSNLPTETFPEATSWTKTGIDRGNYIEDNTGIFSLLLKTVDVIDLMVFLDSKNLRFLDSLINHYCYNYKYKIWARTKKSKAYHLTWDLYKDLDHPYTKMKRENIYLWSQNLTCKFDLFEN
ncbi:putative WbbJ Acetyltransferase [Acanthamoeba polyphaga mimivirus]|nr:putative WbbJ Acetyltransferase [Mimivirus reunion]WMV61488.1 putative WbbJ Acetyltransferase [Mimivirus sp.]WMV62465.1 putative WbbJ Acetyltransferase [Acanthamoeba polyphaga mimivirus]WMV63442.1 putative WbbJ Acetyltransferase [Mimivirus sp.]